MKSFRIISFVMIFSIFTIVAFSAKKEDKELPPWMEDIKLKGRSTYLVPKGVKREMIGSQIVVEPPNEYVARRIYEIELYLKEKFKEIEDGQIELKKELEELKEALKGIEKQDKEENGKSSE